jgi:hypothetical protein
MKKSLSALIGKQSNILRIAGTVTGLILLVYVLEEQGWGEIVEAVKQIEGWRLALALFLMVISRLAVAGRWYILLRSGSAPISLRESFQVTFAGLFANNFLPTTVGGDVIRLAGALRLRCDAAVSAASLIADRLVGMAGMLMILPVGLPRLLQIQDLRDLIPTSALSVQFGMAATPLGGVLGKLWGRFLRITRRLISTLTVWLRQPRALLLALLFTWIHQICLFSVLTLFFDGMGENISFWLVGGLYSFVYLITLIPISINGYGLQEISMTLVFSRLGGTSLAASLTAALLLRTAVMIVSLPGVAFVPSLLAYSRQSPEAKNAPPAEIV